MNTLASWVPVGIILSIGVLGFHNYTLAQLADYAGWFAMSIGLKYMGADMLAARATLARPFDRFDK